MDRVKDFKFKKMRRIAVLCIPILTVVLLFLYFGIRTAVKPVLVLEAPKSVNTSDQGEFTVDLKLTALGDELYPAASVIVNFDKNYLEFTGVKLGNMMVYENFEPSDDKEVKKPSLVVPTWSCNTELSNQTGEIRAMYMDMTGGRNAYNKDGFDAKKHNTVLRLGFKRKDSASEGNKTKLSIADAAFAASGGDEDKTSLVTGEPLHTLWTKNTWVYIK